MKTVALILSLPALFALTHAMTFYMYNRGNGSIVSSGVRREYELHVPRTHDRTKPGALVISMHGAGGWGVLQRDMSGWNALADEKGFIVVYPSGQRGSGPRVWNVAGRPRGPRDDRFIADLIDALSAEYTIDPKRIYANGLSNGGGMSFALSCRMADRIAAVGMVSAAQTSPFKSCNGERPVPVVALQGTADPVVPYNGGSSWVSTRNFPNYPKFIADWALKNRCDPAPFESFAAPDVVRREYKGCAEGASVVLYTIRRGGHTWPGGQPLPEWFMGRTASINANRVMWEFFEAHPLGQ